MPWGDLREFMAAIDGLGELRTVEDADWDLEIGTIAELNYERKGPALLFDPVKGYPAGYRILTNAMESLPRSLLSIGLPHDLTLDEALEEYERRVASYRPVPPVEVPTGPVLENVFWGNDIDLWKFPTPRWHEGDGNCRYLGTGCVVIQRDPESGEINCGTYRVMVHDETTAGLFIAPSHMGSIIEKKYWERGESCPTVVSFGNEPIVFLVGTAYLGVKGNYELEFAGHLRGAPVEVIREEVTGLPMPATAEIVIAGEVPPPNVESRPEGPFGEWTGYYASGTRPEPVIRVQALYHRNDPIILGMPPVKHHGPTAHFAFPAESINYKQKFKRLGIEDVLEVWRAAVPGVLVVKVRQRYPGHAMKAGLAFAGEYMNRVVIVVDDDINIRDPDDVLWAIGTRCDPETSLTVLSNLQSNPLDPRLPPDKRARLDYTRSSVVINACKPYDWIKEFPPTNVAGPDLRRQVLTKWKKLFP